MNDSQSMKDFVDTAAFLNVESKMRYEINRATKFGRTNTITQRTNKANEAMRAKNSKILKREYTVSQDSKIFDSKDPFPEGSHQKLRE